MNLFGSTRTVVRDRHAIIAPDSHVPSQLPGWRDATATILVAPDMGAGLTQMLVDFAADNGLADFPATANQHAFLVLAGNGVIDGPDIRQDLGAGDFVYCPSGMGFKISGAAGLRLCLFRLPYREEPGWPRPDFLHGKSGDVPGQPFLGNAKACLQVLLPEDARFDFAMNVFTYQPGATLPFVESHVMEHGLLMLDGQGIYRLEEDWYPVTAGDAIWMAPFCPQWFVAMGDGPARYLYCKNVHRFPGFH
jgi:(S)-ureidoglycine aminohydrolase